MYYITDRLNRPSNVTQDRPSNFHETSLEHMQKATRDLIKKTRYLLNDSKNNELEEMQLATRALIKKTWYLLNDSKNEQEEMQIATRKLIKKTRYLLNDSKDVHEEYENDEKSDDKYVTVDKKNIGDTDDEISTNLYLDFDTSFNKSLLRFSGANEKFQVTQNRIFKILNRQIDNLIRIWDPGGKYFSTDSTESTLDFKLILQFQRHDDNEYTLSTVMTLNKNFSKHSREGQSLTGSSRRSAQRILPNPRAIESAHHLADSGYSHGYRPCQRKGR